MLFSHPKDFTPVCTTELGYMAKLKPEFDKRNVKIIGLSVDPVDSHARWANDIEETQGYAPNYPMIGDADLNVSKLYGMLPAERRRDSEGRTPADNQTVRNVFVIGPDKKIKLVLVYPMTTGRNFDEVLRVIDSLQLTAKHKVATPVNWKQGEDVIIAGSVSDDEAKQHLSERLEGAEALYPDRAAAERSERVTASRRRKSDRRRRMIFRQLFDSVSGTYSYLIASRRGGEALIIDPVLEKVDRYLQLLHELDLRLVKAVDTHLHADHVTGLGALRDRTHCMTVMGEQTKADVVSMRVTDGDKLDIEGVSLDVLYTPGPHRRFLFLPHARTGFSPATRC